MYTVHSRKDRPAFEIICSVLHEVLANLAVQLLRAQQVEGNCPAQQDAMLLSVTQKPREGSSA